MSGWLAGGGGGIARIQRGTITIASASTSNTATIAAVDLSRTRVVLLGMTDEGSDTTVQKTSMRVALTNATTVTATVDAAGAGNRIVSFEVVEYVAGSIRSVQRGTINTGTSASGTATITVVNTARTTLDYLGFTSPYSGAAVPGHSQCRLVLTNATTVTATGLGNLGERTIGYQVVEWS